MRLGIAIRRLKLDGPKERDCLAIASGLAQRGHEVVLLAGESSLPLPDGVRLVTGGASAALDQSAPTHFAEWIADLRRRQAFDAIVSFEKGPGDFYHAADSCFAARVGAFRRWIPTNRQAAHLERTTFSPDGAFVFFPSEAQRRDYLAQYPLPPHRFAVLPPIVAVPAGGPGGFYEGRDRERAGLGIADDATLAIHVAGAPFEKGTDRVIAAVATVPTLHLVVVGDRRAERQRRQAQDLDCIDRVWFIDQPDDLPQLLGAADLMLHPARTEIAGRILIDSLLAGTPVITLADCALSEQVARYDAGIVCPSPFEAGSFATLLAGFILAPRLEAAKKSARRASVLLANAGMAPAIDRVEQALIERPHRAR